MGSHGNELALHEITCAFCDETGKWVLTSRSKKAEPNGRKILHFDTYSCVSCAGHVLVLWSASRHGGLHGYRVLPWPLKLARHPKEWPEDVGRYWLQAKRSIASENWDAAAVMARSAMQLALRSHGAKGKNLRDEVDSLAASGLLPPVMKEWAHELRDLGNDSAHPSPEQVATNPEDARATVQFLDYLLEYLYTLPDRIGQFRARRAQRGVPSCSP